MPPGAYVLADGTVVVPANPYQLLMTPQSMQQHQSTQLREALEANPTSFEVEAATVEIELPTFVHFDTDVLGRSNRK